VTDSKITAHVLPIYNEALPVHVMVNIADLVHVI